MTNDLEKEIREHLADAKTKDVSSAKTDSSGAGGKKRKFD